MSTLISRILERLPGTLFRPRQTGFEELMRSVAEDEQYRKLVLWICRQNDFQRRSIIRTQLEIMALKRAPYELKMLLQSMEEAEFAAKVTDFLQERESGHP